MSEQVTLLKDTKLGFGFIENDEYKFRNIQNGEDSQYRNLSRLEILELEKNRNYADDWKNVLVKEPFCPSKVTGCHFYGKVRIGKQEDYTLRFHDLILPVGLQDSVIISSDIGDNCSIVDAKYIANYIIHDCCIIHCVSEIQATNHSKFGNGIVKDGENLDVRIYLHVMNENQGRAVLPFETMTMADAFLGANWPEDRKLQDCLLKLTEKVCPKERGYYGEIGDHSVIKNSGIIKDVNIGPYTYIKGASKLKNLTIKSCKEETTQIGENCDLVNGIIGYGCRIFYGCKAVRFVMGEKSSLKYGARLINSVLGDSSTVSCCEVISNLIFPFHEQHHNNSFLISSLIMGQSNMAAGANIGSNHNSRAADCELRAGRGFWPALSSTIKFDSRFASFVIVSKGNYINELNIKLPFSLLSEDSKENRRVLMPAYWWLYNMYALERNSSKFKTRDTRFFAKQHVETDYLAPDTAWEILDGIRLLCKWTAYSTGFDPSDGGDAVSVGYDILLNRPSELSGHDVLAMHQENSKTRMRILKPVEGFNAYREMLVYYGIKEIVNYCSSTGETVKQVFELGKNGILEFTNMGGQLVPAFKVEKLKQDIKDGTVDSWEKVHAIYDLWWKEYPLDKVMNAVAVLKKVINVEEITESLWEDLLVQLRKTRSYIDEQVFITREKDYRNKFRMCTFRNQEERNAVIGKLEDNSFIRATKEESLNIIDKANSIRFN